MKMIYLSTVLIGLFLGFGINSYTQYPLTENPHYYIPETSTSIETAEVILEYSFKPGANRPGANFNFKDGFEIDLNAVCEGEYNWCIRMYENDEIVNLGSLKMEFHNDGNDVIIETRIDNNSQYKKYLDLLPGKYKKAE